MAAALAVRDQTLVKATLQKEATRCVGFVQGITFSTDVPLSAAGLANPDALFQNAIFRGDFLDTRSVYAYTSRSRS